MIIDDGTMRDRFVICHNPDEAARDKHVREQLLAKIAEAIAGSDELPARQRHKLYGELCSKRGYKRLLRTTKTGLLRIDRAAVEAEAHLDGKFLLRTSDPTLSVEDIALGYKQLLVIERAWRDMKTTLDLRPIHHRKEDRIRAHVLLCWLALLLIRIAETQTSQTWCNLRDELERMHLGTFTGPAGTSQQRTELTAGQRDILRALGVANRRCSYISTPPSRPPPSDAPEPQAGLQPIDTRRTHVRHTKLPAHKQVLAPITSNELRNSGRGGSDDLPVRLAMKVGQEHQPALGEVRVAQAVVDRGRVAQRPPGLASRVDLPPHALPFDAQLDEIAARSCVCVSSGAE